MGATRLSGPRQAWDREYNEIRAYTTSYRGDIDRGVRFLLEYLSAGCRSIDGPIVDCGCGMGRNAIPLACAGHDVVGLEHSAAALEKLEETRADATIAGSLTAIQHDLREPLPLADGFAAAVIDITAVDNIVDEPARRRYGDEVARILRPEGVAVVVTFARDDGYYGRWLHDSPWKDRGVVEDPHTGIRNQLFTPSSLDAVFSPLLEREVGATLVFVDDAAGVSWTRRFLLHVYRRLAVTSTVRQASGKSR